MAQSCAASAPGIGARSIALNEDEGRVAPVEQLAQFVMDCFANLAGALFARIHGEIADAVGREEAEGGAYAPMLAGDDDQLVEPAIGQRTDDGAELDRFGAGADDRDDPAGAPRVSRHRARRAPRRPGQAAPGSPNLP